MYNPKRLVRFDWAIKRLLRQKANFVILEGFLSVLFNVQIKIEEILESESNRSSEDDKSNKVDILVKNEIDEYYIIEVQNNNESDFFHRMNYGASKIVVEYLKKGAPYKDIKKVYGVNIVYFDLGQGNDYVYDGKTEFIGRNIGDKLMLSARQQEEFNKTNPSDIFAEYVVLRLNEFNNVAKSDLDEWMYYLKNSELPPTYKAQGLEEAGDVLKEMLMTKEEYRAYERHIENEVIGRDIERTAINTAVHQGRQEGIKIGIEQANKDGIIKSLNKGISPDVIADIFGVSIEYINTLK